MMETATLRRLRRMSPAEVLERSRQRALAALDRTALGRIFLEGGEPPQDLPDELLVRPAVRGFARPFETARAVEERAPSEAEHIVRCAERISEGRFGVLGFGRMDYGLDPDWRRDPVQDKRCPPGHFSRIDPLDADRVGDHKAVWEVNRHAFLKTLGQAYALTRDPRYPEVAASLLESWLRQNPRSRGINYTSSLEMAFRVINWLMVWPLMASTSSFDARSLSEWWRAMCSHLAHIRHFLSTYFSPNTHLTGEALALYLAGLLAPRSNPAGLLRDRGRRVLDSELRRQILRDGLHFERSACYHLYTLEFLVLGAEATALHDLESDDTFRELLSKSVDAALALVRPDGRMVNVGDEDGGALLQLGSAPPLDPRPILAIAAIMLGRGDVKAVVGELPPETIWFLGARAPAEWEDLDAEAPPPRSACLAQSGYCAIRSGWDSFGDHLLLDVGKHGAPPNAGHAHDDALSVNLSLQGTPLFIERGTGSYADPEIRNEFRGTLAHNTLWIDHERNCQPEGAFGWSRTRDARLEEWLTSEGVAMVEGSAPVGHPQVQARHVRRVVYWRDGGWAIWDRVLGSRPHRVTLQYLLPFAPAELDVEEKQVTSPAGEFAFLLPSGELDVELREMEWSPRYGEYRRGTGVRTTFTAEPPAQILTRVGAGGSLFRASDSFRVEGETFTGPAGVDDCRLLVEAPANSERLLLQPLSGGTMFGSEDLTTDAVLLWSRGQPPCWRGVVVGGTTLRRGGRPAADLSGTSIQVIESDGSSVTDPSASYASSPHPHEATAG